MKRLLFLSATLLLLQAGASAQTNKLIRYLPQDANMVMSFNPMKIANYVPGDVFRQSAMYREMMKGDDGELRAFLSDPSVSGIDFSADLMLTVTLDTTNGNDDATVCVFGVLKNEALFSLAIKKTMKGEEAKLQTFGTNRIFQSGNASPAFAWNDEIFVFTTGNRGAMKREMQNMFGNWGSDSITVSLDTMAVIDTVPKPMPGFNMDKIFEKFNKQIRNYCFELLTPKNNSSFFTNTYLTNLLNEKGDIKFLSTGSGWGSSLNKLPQEFKSIFSKLKLYPESTRTGVLNFENGKITSAGSNYLSPEMDALYKKYGQLPLKTDLIKRLPANGKILMLFTASAHPEMAKEMMQTTGLNSLLNEYKEKIPFEPGLLSSALGTTAMFAVLNMPVKHEPVPDSIILKGRDAMFEGMQVVLAIPVKNKAKLEELKDSVAKFFDSLKEKKKAEDTNENTDEDMDVEEKTGPKMFRGLKPSYKYNDSLFVISTSEEVATSYINSTGNGELPSCISSAAGYPMLMNFNFKEFIGMLYKSEGNPENEKDRQLKEMFDMFGDMNIYGGKYENGVISSKMEMKMGNPDENSFKQLFDLINKAAEAKNKEREEWDDAPKEDGVKIEEATMDEGNAVIEMPPPPPPAKKVIKPQVNKAPVKKKN